MWRISFRGGHLGRKSRAAWAIFVFGGMAMLPACGKKLDCDAFSKKAKTCSVELYLALSGPETAFIERMVDNGPGLDDASRHALDRAWREQRAKLAGKLADRLASKCRKDHGRYKQSESLQACLSKKNCKEFAACCAEALGIEKKSLQTTGGTVQGKGR